MLKVLQIINKFEFTAISNASKINRYKFSRKVYNFRKAVSLNFTLISKPKIFVKLRWHYIFL